MAEKKWRSEIRLVGDSAAAERASAEDVSEGDRPFILTIMGDFSGAGEGGSGGESGALADRRFVEIDRDNFDAVLKRFGVCWQGVLGGTAGGQEESQISIQLGFRELDDFHPDRIVRRIEPLRRLVETRSALHDPSRFEAAQAEIKTWAMPEGPATQETAPPPPRRDGG